jgi:O-antigen/teichoic acid export membrane protein
MTAARAFAQIISWISTIVVIRLLTPADYGLVAMATLFTGYLMFLGDLGLGTALISRREADPLVLRAAYGASMLAGMVLCAVMAGVAPLVASYFRNESLTPLMQASSLLFLAIGISTAPRALLAIEMRFREISLAGMTSSLISTITTLYMAWAGYGAWSLIIGTLAGSFARALQMQLYVGGMPRPLLALQPLHGLFRLSGFLLANMTVWYWYTQIDALIVGRKLGDVSLGLLTVGKELAFMPISKVAEITNQIARPAFSRLQDSPGQVADGYTKSLRLASIVSFPALWGLALTAQDLVTVVLGEKWQAAVLVIQILAAVMPVRLSGAFAAAVLQGIGRPELTFYYTLKTLALSGIILLFSTRWGLTGVAVAWAISIPLGFLLGLNAVASCIPVNRTRILRETLMAALPAFIMGLAVVASQVLIPDASPVLRLATSIGSGILVWLVAARLLTPSLWRELMRVGGKLLGLRRS